MKTLFFTFGIIILLLSLSACEGTPPTDPEPTPPFNDNTVQIPIPTFDGDSAYHFVKTQVEFGPRVPETDEHRACSEWIRQQFESFGWQVQFQDAEIMGPDNQPMQLRNIIATYNPEQDERLLLCAHWDTRAIADQDTTRRNEPILGADDGASGVGVLLELARVVGQNPLNMGLEIVLFDVEDQGENNSPRPPEQTWCLGAQFWSRNIHPMKVMPRFGVLLDMVGALGAQFPMEGVSLDRAAPIVSLFWNEAAALGYGNLFVQEQDDNLVDDHLYVNDITGIPTIDIINRPIRFQNGVAVMNRNENRHERRFAPYWHTHFDDMPIIDKHTLRMVGEVLLSVLYKEAAL